MCTPYMEYSFVVNQLQETMAGKTKFDFDVFVSELQVIWHIRHFSDDDQSIGVKLVRREDTYEEMISPFVRQPRAREALVFHNLCHLAVFFSSGSKSQREY